MRLLHTSDWHLGRSFHREDLLGAQAAFIDDLVETVRAERVDAVLVSGDIYDRALPSVDAVALCNDALRRLAATGARTVVISGNHDSARRLGFGSELIDAAGVHLRTDPARLDVPVLLEDAAGLVACYALPYLEPDAVRSCLDCPEGGHDAIVRTAMARVRADLARRRGVRSVLLAHAFVAGGAACESERDIRVGGAAAVPMQTFAGIDYVALGHLHGAQTLAPSVRYSGSPLAYSFSEQHHRKSVTLVELGAAGVTSVLPVPCPVPRRVARIRGHLDDLLSDPRWAGVEDCFLQVTLTDPDRPREPMERLRRRFPHTLVLAFEPDSASPTMPESYAQRLRGRSDLEVSLSFVEHVRGRGASDAEAALLQQALEAQRLAETESAQPAQRVATLSSDQLRRAS